MSSVGLLALCGRDGFVRGYAVIDESDRPLLRSYTWRLHTLGYAVAREGAAIIYMHRLLCDLHVGDCREADHINRNKLDNRRANLRVVTDAEQSQNTPARRGGTSQYRGVCFDRRLRRWRAGAQLNGKQHHIGVFASEEDAAEAAATWRREHMGEMVA